MSGPIVVQLLLLRFLPLCPELCFHRQNAFTRLSLGCYYKAPYNTPAQSTVGGGGFHYIQTCCVILPLLVSPVTVDVFDLLCPGFSHLSLTVLPCSTMKLNVI